MQHPRTGLSIAKGTTGMRNTTDVWMLITGLLAVVVVALAVNLIVPQFEDVLRNFGAETPLLTRLFVNGRYAFFALPLMVFAAWVLTPRRTPPGNERGIVALVLGVGLAVILVPLCVIAVYLPIFRMAAAAEG
jgi:type II secretory pathway component PulF